jgi:hypothetical protein
VLWRGWKHTDGRCSLRVFKGGNDKFAVERRNYFKLNFMVC